MNFSPTTIFVIIVAAVLIFGPDKLPELARKTARVVHFVRNIANQAQDTVRTELGPEFADFDIRNPRKFVADKILGDYGDIAGELDDVRSTVRGAADDLRGHAADATTVVAAQPGPVPSASEPIETTVVETRADGPPSVAQVELESDDEAPDWRDAHVARYQAEAAGRAAALQHGGEPSANFYDIDAT